MKINLTKLLKIRKRVFDGHVENGTTNASMFEEDKTANTSPEDAYSFELEDTDNNSVEPTASSK